MFPRPLGTSGLYPVTALLTALVPKGVYAELVNPATVPAKSGSIPANPPPIAPPPPLNARFDITFLVAVPLSPNLSPNGAFP